FGRVVFECTHFFGELDQYRLRYVLGVGLLEVPLPAPCVDFAAVALRELSPGCLIRRHPAEERQQGHARGRSQWRYPLSPTRKRIAFSVGTLLAGKRKTTLCGRFRATADSCRGSGINSPKRAVRFRFARPYGLSSPFSKHIQLGESACISNA